MKSKNEPEGRLIDDDVIDNILDGMRQRGASLYDVERMIIKLEAWKDRVFLAIEPIKKEDQN